MGNTLAIDADQRRLCVNGRPTFLFGASYFAGLGADEQAIQEDLAELKQAAVNCLRVWATWRAFDNDISAIDADGDERSPYWDRLLWLVELADKLGFVVDVTIDRGTGVLTDDDAHLNAAGVLAEALRERRNVYFDLANKRNAADARQVPSAILRQLRDRVKQADPDRLVTASNAGDLDPDRLYEYITAARLDFLTPHRPRQAGSPGQTAQKTELISRRMQRLGKVVPVLYQEPFRRGLDGWQPGADDFLTDLRAAIDSGAAGWFFHNGPAGTNPEARPRRCFDLRPNEGRLMPQLDNEERTFLLQAARHLRGKPIQADRQRE